MRYKFVNGTDYRKDNISVKYQLQAIHMTKVYHYNDTLDMLVISTDPSMTTIRVCLGNEPLVYSKVHIRLI